MHALLLRTGGPHWESVRAIDGAERDLFDPLRFAEMQAGTGEAKKKSLRRLLSHRLFGRRDFRTA
jgi:hypothetical protein